MSDTVEIHERLAVLETGQVYTNKRLDEVCELLKEHSSAACDGSCPTAKQVVTIETSLKTYRRLTWASLVMLIAAGLRSLYPS